MTNESLIFGCGYLGERVAKLWTADGQTVHAVTRSTSRATDLRRAGIVPLVADVTNPDSLCKLPQVDTALFAVGYDRTSDHSIDQVYAQGMRNVLAALPKSVRRLIYISTTGVYGDADGGWVGEETPPNPSRAGGKASLAAEEAIGESPFAARAVILRLAGIYGPNRLPYLKQLQAGEPIEASQSGHLNLIHVDDAARIVQSVAHSELEFEGPRVYCVSDGDPPVRGEYYCEVARLLNAPEPTFAAPAAGSHRAARAAADKRVSNRRLLAEVTPSLLYPTYREGLAAIVQTPRSP